MRVSKQRLLFYGIMAAVWAGMGLLVQRGLRQENTQARPDLLTEPASAARRETGTHSVGGADRLGEVSALRMASAPAAGATGMQRAEDTSQALAGSRTELDAGKRSVREPGRTTEKRETPTHHAARERREDPAQRQPVGLSSGSTARRSASASVGLARGGAADFSAVDHTPGQDEVASATAAGERAVAAPETAPGDGSMSADLARTEDPITETQSGQEHEATAEEPEQIVPSVYVWRGATIGNDGSVTVKYVLDVDEGEPVPSGLVVCERIPPGWQIVSGQPWPVSVNDQTRLVKWLFMTEQVGDGTFSYTAEPSSDMSATEDWSLAASWYSYRRPYDERPLDFYCLQY